MRTIGPAGGLSAGVGLFPPAPAPGGRRIVKRLWEGSTGSTTARPASCADDKTEGIMEKVQ